MYDIDPKFMQAKFLHFYPGYTWDMMMEPRRLPFGVFISLYKLIDAVEADRAIETEIPTLGAIFSGKIDKVKRKLDNVFEIRPEFDTVKAKEADMREAFRISSQIKQARKKEKEQIKLKKKVK